MAEKQSAINGHGYGDAHSWRYVGQRGSVSFYVCTDCGERFAHAYNEPGMGPIFAAMKKCGVAEQCKRATEQEAEDGN